MRAKKGPYTDENNKDRQYCWASGLTQPPFNSIPAVPKNNSRPVHTHTHMHAPVNCTNSGNEAPVHNKQPPSLDEDGEPIKSPNSLPLSFSHIHIEREGGRGACRVLAFGTNRRSQSPRDPRDEGKARGRLAEEGFAGCHFQAGSLWSKALREKENKTNEGGGLHLLLPLLLFHVEVSVLSREVNHCRQRWYSLCKISCTCNLQ